jgi:hypothetical protein
MIDATMVASLIAPVPAPDIAFVCWCCCVVPSLWRKSLVSAKNNDQQTDDGRRDELVHLLHSLRLPCPHNEETSKSVHSALRSSRVPGRRSREEVKDVECAELAWESGN